VPVANPRDRVFSVGEITGRCALLLETCAKTHGVYSARVNKATEDLASGVGKYGVLIRQNLKRFSEAVDTDHGFGDYVESRDDIGLLQVLVTNATVVI